jgi:hypothetical protein
METGTDAVGGAMEGAIVAVIGSVFALVVIGAGLASFSNGVAVLVLVSITNLASGVTTTLLKGTIFLSRIG